MLSLKTISAVVDAAKTARLEFKRLQGKGPKTLHDMGSFPKHFITREQWEVNKNRFKDCRFKLVPGLDRLFAYQCKCGYVYYRSMYHWDWCLTNPNGTVKKTCSERAGNDLV